MAGKKSTRKQKDSDTRAGEIAEQLEHAFLAGLGALSDARKEGARKFDTLVKEGEKFREKTTSKTESLIDDVQGAIRDMADDAQSKATGLLDQVRGKSSLDKLHSAFDSRVAGAMDRLNVPSKNDIDAINKKLNKILRLLDDQGKPAAKKKATRKSTTRKKAAKKKTAKPKK
ncbi:MAG: phasin family protein [Gammaproteobacteria bacterium]|nr:phasin family protein [Gammaproteobacteria bacterium]